MVKPNADALAHQMHDVKDLYAELFLLLVQSVEQDPESPGLGGLDQTIERLMLTIDSSMHDFLEAARTSRANHTIPTDLDGEVIQFEQQLKEGLTSMHRRVQSRVDEMARQREELKDRLQLVQRKRHGAKGYRKGLTPSQIRNTKLKAEV